MTPAALSAAGDERGAGSVLAMAVLATALAVTVAALPLYMGFAESRRVAVTADAAALAAADTASGALPGVPCEAANAIAALADLTLTRCEVESAIASVIVRGSTAGIPIVARSRAGPPDAHSERHDRAGLADD